MRAPDIRLGKNPGDPALEIQVSACLDLVAAVREFRGLNNLDALMDLAIALKPVLQKIVTELESDPQVKIMPESSYRLMIATGILLAACYARDAGISYISKMGFAHVKQSDDHLEGREMDLSRVSIRISTDGADFMRLAIPDFITAAEDYLGSNAPASENGRVSKRAS